jgi:hypothetical protein
MKRSLGLKNFHAYLTPEQYRFLEAEAFARQTTMSNLAREIIEAERRRVTKRRERQSS